MPIRTSEATWLGNLASGSGNMIVGEGLFEGAYTRASRFEEGEGTNPEELLGAAHAGCYSMYLSAILSGDDHPPNSVHTTARVHIGTVDGAPTIHTIELDTEASVPGIDQDTLLVYAERAKKECPVSKALSGVSNVEVNARLVGEN